MSNISDKYLSGVPSRNAKNAYDVMLALKIRQLELENKMLMILSNSNGFYAYYITSLHSFKDEESCFWNCNNEYRKISNTLRYQSFEDFAKEFQLKKVAVLQPKSKESLEREFLLSWFKACGFDTWTSFKAIVLHYYPEVTEVKLLAFWQNTAIDPLVLIRVNHTKQILG